MKGRFHMEGDPKPRPVVLVSSFDGMVHTFWMTRGNRGFSNCGNVAHFTRTAVVTDCGLPVNCLDCIADGDAPTAHTLYVWNTAEMQDAVVDSMSAKIKEQLGGKLTNEVKQEVLERLHQAKENWKEADGEADFVIAGVIESLETKE